MEELSSVGSSVTEVKFRRILYPTDLSVHAKQAFDFAMSLSLQYDAPLVILHVLTEASDMAINYIGVEQWEKIKQSHYDHAREVLIGKSMEFKAIKEALVKFCEAAKEELNCQVNESDKVIVDSGQPDECILRHAKAEDCDLIVMASHGLSGSFLNKLGSIARKVLRNSQIPVMVIPISEP